jgi:hypothetical protein
MESEMRAPLKRRQEQAAFLLALATQVHAAVMNDDDDNVHSCGQSRARGTVTNLCPEIAKAAAALSKATRGSYDDN